MLMYVGTSAWGIPLPSCAGEGMEKIQNDTVLFRFVPGKRMFWADYRGNRQSIERLQTFIREHKDAIFSGSEKVRILGFCSSYGSVKENLAVAKNRSNQVKSYYIVHEGLKEEHFIQPILLLHGMATARLLRLHLWLNRHKWKIRWKTGMQLSLEWQPARLAWRPCLPGRKQH